MKPRLWQCLMYVVILLPYFCFVNGNELENLDFPEDFIIGAATAAFQVEGAWNLSGKGESLWDRYTHSKSHRIRDHSNGDIACDSYHKYKEDVRLLKQMGMDFYRFSFSWPRILPTGYANNVNKNGIKYYHELLDELEKHNIKPMVTLYHWDHPQVFQELGGWTNEVMVDLFGNYARVVFQEFGHRVKIFSTINEPASICTNGYFVGSYAPGLERRRDAEYLCNHNIIKAHARAYHIYDKEFRPQQQGKIGIVLSNVFYFSKNDYDHISDEIGFQFQFGMYAHAIFTKEGDYPAIIKKRIAENSAFEGLPSSRLPTFSKDWINYIKNTSDYLGINHYTTKLVEPAPKSNCTIYENDDGLVYSYDEQWHSTASDWIKIVPEGFLALLLKIKDEYGNLEIYITENGVSDSGTLEDNQRIKYYYSYIKSLLIAIKKHNCNIKGYTLWSLLDNFEWDRGYTEKFGLFHVDFSSPNRTRTPKKSTNWLKQIIRERKLLPIPT
ncbi:myrosinase 1-like isoform X2 [Phymastichus coffea]|uniref:myrosinase 1-like isoform X2 n=1 Tax=Phymastichus coffea TaxID=108790 RepID=UPI00273C98FD|nr:myrosinase 1-like isoform X2 [Phymastichus coffea]